MMHQKPIFVLFAIGVDVKTLLNTLVHYRAELTLDTYTYTTQRMKQEATDAIGSVIYQAM